MYIFFIYVHIEYIISCLLFLKCIYLLLFSLKIKIKCIPVVSRRITLYKKYLSYFNFIIWNRKKRVSSMKIWSWLYMYLFYSCFRKCQLQVQDEFRDVYYVFNHDLILKTKKLKYCHLFFIYKILNLLLISFRIPELLCTN